MHDFLWLVLSNFTVTFFVLGMAAACVALARRPRPLSHAVVSRTLFGYFLLFSVGLANIYNFVMHAFFGDVVARFIGWAPSPFQLEVAFASLGFGLVGLLAFRAGLGFRAAAVTTPAVFLWGAAGGHLYQMIATGNFAPGNAGSVFWTDFLLPVVGFALLGWEASCAKRGREDSVSRSETISSASLRQRGTA
jgi:hypothetical protein